MLTFLIAKRNLFESSIARHGQDVGGVILVAKGLMAARGLSWASQFSWEECSRDWLELRAENFLSCWWNPCC